MHLIYLATGILADIAILWRQNGTIGVGASGSIYGLYGVILAWLVTKRISMKSFSKPFVRSTLLYVAICLILEFTGGDNFVHIGGLLTGFIIGLLFTQGKTRLL